MGPRGTHATHITSNDTSPELKQKEFAMGPRGTHATHLTSNDTSPELKQ